VQELNMVRWEITDTFWIRGPDGHKYKVHCYTEYCRFHFLGQTGWEVTKHYYMTDGGDAVNDLGNGRFFIRAMNVLAEWLPHEEVQQVTLELPRPFMGMRKQQ